MEGNNPKDQQTNSVNLDINAPNANESKQPRRGRPRKLGKPKIPRPIVATGKGRGRPKKPPVSADELGDDAVVNCDVERTFPVRQSKTGSCVEARGRPRKEKIYSDSENSSYDERPDYEERRPVGRPNAGAVNLNIVRTGRGQGRPRKSIQSTRPLSTHSQSNETKPVQKRGRPSEGGVVYVRTGKPRGRPKVHKATPLNSIEKTSEENHNRGRESDFGEKEGSNLLNSEAVV